jgi:hypothetical protein
VLPVIDGLRGIAIQATVLQDMPHISMAGHGNVSGHQKEGQKERPIYPATRIILMIRRQVMKVNLEKRLKNLEDSNVYRIDSLADLVLWRAKRARGDPVPELVEWDPTFEKMWKEAFSKDKKKS